MITLQFATSKGFGSAAIRAFTWSQFSHVDFVLPDGTLLGARSDGGVLIRQPNYESFTAVNRFYVDAPDSVLSFAHQQIGKPYDWRGILNFGLHRNWRETDCWFCSELVEWCFEQAKSPLLSTATDVRRYTPRDLTLSPRLIPIGGQVS